MSTYPGASQNQGRSGLTALAGTPGGPEASQTVGKRFPARVAVTEPNTIETTDLDITTRMGIDLDKTIPCGGLDGGTCDQTAAWHWYHCCATRDLCERHDAIAWGRYQEHRGTIYGCANCATRPMPAPIRKKL